MKVMNYLLIIGLLMVSGNIFAQKSLKKANALYKLNQFSEAIPLYESAIAKKPSLSAKTKLAYCYRMTNKMAPAAKLYAEIVKEERSTTISKFYYAETLMGIEKYDEAQEWFIKYHTERPDDRQAEALIRACKGVKYIQPYFQNIKVKNFTQNSDNDDSAPILYKDGIVFCSDRKQGAKLLKKKSGWTGRDFLAVYFSQQNIDDTFEPAKSFSGKINELNKNTGPVTFNREGNEIIYTQNSSVANRRDQYPMQLYHASMEEEGSKWKGKEVIPFCSSNYNYMHPALSPDGQRLFFISDKKGGEGGTDIFMAERTDRGWTRPKNLGNVVNTVSNEAFPFVHEDGKLYFSSKGHIGYGGFDIFFTEQQADGTWSPPVNVGKPINSATDDISIAIAPDNKSGAFSSSRKKGDDDIFLFKTSGGNSSAPYSITLVEEEAVPVAASQPVDLEAEQPATAQDPGPESSAPATKQAEEVVNQVTEEVKSPTRIVGSSSEDEQTGYTYEIQPQEIPAEQKAKEAVNNATAVIPAEQSTVKDQVSKTVDKVNEQATESAEANPQAEIPSESISSSPPAENQNPATNTEDGFSYEINSPAVNTEKVTSHELTEVKTPPTKHSVETSTNPANPNSSTEMGSENISTDETLSQNIGEAVQKATAPVVNGTDASNKIEEASTMNNESIPTEALPSNVVGESVQEITIPIENGTVIPDDVKILEERPASQPSTSGVTNPAEEAGTPVKTPPSSMDGKRINTAPTFFEGTVSADSRTSTPAPKDAPLTIQNYIDLGYALSKERATVGQAFRLPNISYAFDAFDFQVNDDIATELNKLADIMKEHPDLKLEIGGHTSSYGEDRVNLEISRERADAALSYLIGQGISSDRLVSRGYGETQPQNHCVNGVLCSRDEHLMNQRLEIKVLEH